MKLPDYLMNYCIAMGFVVFLILAVLNRTCSSLRLEQLGTQVLELLEYCRILSDILFYKRILLSILILLYDPNYEILMLSGK